ncbi:hypothetical protein TURU_104861 [Turdus rufiventris]|nr:hypothetical protein TURU_104861 [Turdus rufiventris]
MTSLLLLAIDLLGHQGTLLAHVQSADRYSQVPFCLGTVQPHHPQPVILQGVIVAKMQDLALGVIKPHPTGLCPSIQLVQVSLQSPPTFQQIDSCSQISVICKFTNEALNSLIHVINKNIEQDRLPDRLTDPWGTPLVTGPQLDAAPFTTTLWSAHPASS